MNDKSTKDFKFVNFLWEEKNVLQLENNQVDLLIYRSNLLGSDLRITNFGGGNTSCKTIEKDMLTGEEAKVMWVKGSGGDIGTLTRSGLASLYVDKLNALKLKYRGLEHEDEMVDYFRYCLYDLDSKAPSIDTPLHAFLPFDHIDHLHPDAIIAIAAAKDGEIIAKEIFGDEVAWIPWQRPGFDLALQLESSYKNNPHISCIILGGHGLFTWGNTSFDCYINSLDKIERASQYLEERLGKNRPVFGGVKFQSLSESERKSQAAKIAPLLRGLCSSYQLMIGHFTDNDRVLEFVNSKDLDRLAPMGTSCPDHFLRTKIKPLILDLPSDINLQESSEVQEKIEPLFETYRQDYHRYYEENKENDSPKERDPNPVIILWPGVGMFSFAKNKQTSRIASEFYINAVNVMRGAETLSSYVSLPEKEAFDIEYWALEEAKLQRMPLEKPLSRKVAFVTGGAGGIGKSIGEMLMANGACVVFTDIHDESGEVADVLKKDQSCYLHMNVNNQASIDEAMQEACLQFGGIDILVNCAGLAISKPIEETSIDDWNKLQDVIVKGQFKVSKTAIEVMRSQKKGGSIVNIASKNGLVSGPNNIAYGTAKAAQIHMSRLMSSELAKDGIRVNVVNPDAVIVGSKIWEGKWAEGRAKAYGISVDELPQHYAKRNLLNEIILPEDIAKAVFALVNGYLSKSTGNIINVDGGIQAAFTR